MKKREYILAFVILLGIGLFAACSSDLDKEEANTNSNLDSNTLKSRMKEAIGHGVDMPEKTLQEYHSKILKMIKEDDKTSLKKEAIHIRDDYKNNPEEQALYQNLYYTAFYKSGLKSKDDKGEVFLNVDDIQNQPIREALFDIGLVYTGSEESLQELRADVIRLIRGKDDTQAEFDKYLADFEEAIKSMNNIDASSYRAVFTVAQKEAFNGSINNPKE